MPNSEERDTQQHSSNKDNYKHYIVRSKNINSEGRITTPLYKLDRLKPEQLKKDVSTNTLHFSENAANKLTTVPSNIFKFEGTVYLEHCHEIRPKAETIAFFVKAEAKHNKTNKIYYPESFSSVNDFTNNTKERLTRFDPENKMANVKLVLNRFLNNTTESTIKESAFYISKVMNVIKKHCNSLGWMEKEAHKSITSNNLVTIDQQKQIDKTTLTKLSVWASIYEEESFIEKLNLLRQLKATEIIENRYKTNKKTINKEGLTNMIHKKLVESKKTKEWVGLPHHSLIKTTNVDSFTFAIAIKIFPNIKKIYDLPAKEMIDFAVKNLEIWKEVAFNHLVTNASQSYEPILKRLNDAQLKELTEKLLNAETVNKDKDKSEGKKKDVSSSLSKTKTYSLKETDLNQQISS